MKEFCRNGHRRDEDNLYEMSKKSGKRCRACATERNKKNWRKYTLKHKYGITESDYYDKLDEQNGLCAICGNPNDQPLCVDHDHSNGKFRGILGSSCNKGIGNLKDDPVILLSAIAYLSIGEVS